MGIRRSADRITIIEWPHGKPIGSTRQTGGKMIQTRGFFTATVVALVVGLLTISACSDDESTNPPDNTAKLFDSGDVPNGATFQFTFNDSGAVPYHCEIHPIMKGTVTVASGQADFDTVTIVNASATGFSPQNVSIRPGGFVLWINKSVTHRVTSDS